MADTVTGTTGCPAAFQVRVGRPRALLDVEGDVEGPQAGPELGDVVAVDQLIRVVVEQVDAGTAQDEDDLVLARDDAEPDAHGLVGPVGLPGIGADDHEDGGRLVHPRGDLRSSSGR